MLIHMHSRGSSIALAVVVGILALLAWPSDGRAAGSRRLSPAVLTSATAFLTQRTDAAQREKVKGICDSQDKGLKELSAAVALRDNVARLPESPTVALMEGLIARGVPANTLPSNNEVDSPQGRLRLLASRQALIDSARADVTRRSAEMRASLSSAMSTATLLPCEATSCGDRILTACNQGGELPPSIAAKSGSSVSPAPGVSWLQNIAAPALADFVGDRAAAEVSLWLVSSLEDEICSEARTYFQNGCSLVASLKIPGAQVPSLLLASAFRRDIEALPIMMLKVNGRLDDTSAAILVGLLTQVRDGESPLALLASLATNKDIVDGCKKNAQSTSCILQGVGLLISLTGDAVNAPEGRFDESLPQMAEALTTYFQTACTGEMCSQIAAQLSQAKAKVVLQASFNLANKLRDYSTGTVDGNALQRAAEITSLTGDLVDSAVAIMPPSKTRDDWVTVATGVRVAAGAFRGDYTEATRELLQFAEAEKFPVPPSVARYAPFVVEMAAAKTAAEAKVALDSAAAPVGSWRVKRRGVTTSVTALIGGALGYETPAEGEGRRGSAAGTALGSIGLDVAIPCGNWTFGPYISLLDVGQLLSTPIGAASTTDENGTKSTAEPGGDIKAVQLFSPGLYLRVGAGNTPFTFGVGATVAPKLRQYSDETSAGASKDIALTMIRANAFLAVDVTILPF